MGCDIHSYVESQSDNGQWERVAWPHGDYPDEGPFGWRDYGMFAWLADVRNYSALEPIAAPRGLPEGISDEVRAEEQEWSGDYHSASWLSVDEMLSFDFEQEFEDRRGGWGVTVPRGGGSMCTYREYLGPAFFRDLEELRKLNDVRPTRIVYWFDN